MKNWFKVFILFFMFGLLLYFNSLNNKFLMDDYIFLKNPVDSSTKFLLSQWDPYREKVLGIVGSDQCYYRPMAHMVLDFCYGTFKNNYWQYHLFNLFLFVFASSLIYLLIEKITGNYNLAFLTGIFYLIHPVNGIIVNYISACVFAFQLICTLCTILLLLRSLENKNDRWLYSLSLLFSFLSMFWNESGVMTPFYVCAVVLLFRKDPVKEKSLYLFPYFFIVLCYMVFRHLFINHDTNLIKLMVLHAQGWARLAGLFRIFMWYIFQLFYPQGVVMAWSTPILHDHIIGHVLGACLLLALFILLFMKFDREKICQLALILLLIGFAPVCLAAFRMPEIGAYIEPHWLVISSIGFFILAAHFCLRVLERLKRTGSLFLFILIFTWGSLAHANNLLWADQTTYALYWTKQDPDLKIANFYLGEGYMKEGDLKDSRKYFRSALSGYPMDMDIYNNLGGLDQQEGHFKEAELNYKMALKLNRYAAPVYSNLGSIYFVQGRYDKAKEYFNRALMLNPLMLDTRSSLASIFLKQSEYQKALDLCLKNLAIVGDDPNTLLLMADIFIQKKDIASLNRCVYRILSQETDPGVLTRLGVDLAQHNIPRLALECFMKAVHLSQGYKDAYFDTGTLLANLGHYDQAIQILKIGSDLDPSDKRFKVYIAKVLSLCHSRESGNPIQNKC